VKSEEFIREVDEELRRDRLGALWRRYGALVVAAALVLIAGTAAAVAWGQWRERAQAAEAARFAAAGSVLQTAAADAAGRFAALAAEGDTGFADLARLKEAEARLAAADPAGAVAAVEGLAARGDAADPILRDLAALLAAERRLEAGEDPEALRQALEPLAAAGAPWRHQARELLALAAIRAGRLEDARTLLGELGREAGVSPSQQRRAEELLQAIGGAVPQASS
jgi:hypothetical protein